MRPMICTLHDYFDQMLFNQNYSVIKNGKEIVRQIKVDHHMPVNEFTDICLVHTPRGFTFGIEEYPIYECLAPCLEEQVIKSIKQLYFPQLSEETIFSVLYGIYSIMSTVYLDIHVEQTVGQSEWYFQQTAEDKVINRPYFYEAFQNYCLSGERAEFFYTYLTAASSSTEGGLKTIAHIDVTEIDGKQTIAVPDTPYTYENILTVLVHSSFIQKLIKADEEYFPNTSLEKIQSGLLFLEELWKSFSIEASELEKLEKGPGIFDYKKDIIRKEKIGPLIWKQFDNYQLYDSCHFIDIDFSNEEVASDFIFCTFERCCFQNTIISEERIFPILRCVFLHCQGSLVDLAYQGFLKNRII